MNEDILYIVIEYRFQRYPIECNLQMEHMSCSSQCNYKKSAGLFFQTYSIKGYFNHKLMNKLLKHLKRKWDFTILVQFSYI